MPILQLKNCGLSIKFPFSSWPLSGIRQPIFTAAASKKLALLHILMLPPSGGEELHDVVMVEADHVSGLLRIVHPVELPCEDARAKQDTMEVVSWILPSTMSLDGTRWAKYCSLFLKCMKSINLLIFEIRQQ